MASSNGRVTSGLCFSFFAVGNPKKKKKTVYSSQTCHMGNIPDDI